MRNITLPLFILLLSLSCSGIVKKSDPQEERNVYSDLSSSLKLSSDKIDKGITYELFFTLEKRVNCLTVDINAVYIPGTFPLERIPKQTYFIVEKIINIEKYKSGKSYTYTQLARNFNNEWETFNPVQICGLEGDPLSGIDASNYRIRFTVFDSSPVIFMAAVFSNQKVIFHKSIDQLSF